MTTEIRLEGDGIWACLAELNVTDGVGVRSLDAPDSTQLNNDPMTSGTVAAAVVFVFVKLGQHAITAVRDVLVNRIDGHRCKLNISAGKHKIAYEGPLTHEQSERLLNDLQAIAAELGK